MRKLGVDEWIVRLMKVMYDGANSRLNDYFGERFEVTVDVHQGSILTPLLFAIVIEALSLECLIGCPWELLCSDDLVVMSDNLENLKNQLQGCRTSKETRGLRVNVGKTKILGQQARIKNQQERLNGLVVCVPKELV